MFTNKKGLTYEVMVGAAITIFVIALLLFIFNYSYEIGEDLIDQECNIEVRAHSAALKVNYEPEIYCPTNYPVPIDLSNNNERAEEKVKTTLGDEMVSCWNTWGRGELPLFLAEEGVYCHICSVMEFERKDVIANNMLQFLTETDKGDKKYIEHIIPYSTEDITGIEDDVEASDPQSFAVIETKDRQAVIFKYIKGKDKIIEETQQEDVFISASVLVGVGAGIKAGKAGAVICSPIPGGALGCGLVGAFVGGTAGYFLFGEDQDIFSYVVQIKYDEENLRNLGCEAVPVRQRKDLNRRISRN